MMPVVSASITHGDWTEWEQRTDVKTKGLTQLAFEGHWLLDNRRRRPSRRGRAA